MANKTFLYTFAVLVIVFPSTINWANSYKILGVLPTSAKSHFFVGQALMKGLAEKGHSVTVISPFPMSSTTKNYRHVDTPSITAKMNEVIKNILVQRGQNIAGIFATLYGLGVTVTNSTLHEPSVEKLMASGEQFDVVICEAFATDALFGLAEHFGAPLIVYSTSGATLWNTDLVGTPSPPSYVPNAFLPFTDRMSLSQRITNFAVATIEQIYVSNFYLPKQDALFKQFFPKSKLGLENIRKNTALVLLNTHVSLGTPRPYMPNMIEVGGMHINRKGKPLPAGMKKFLDEAKDGAIYFSMGSNLKSSILPTEKRNVFLQTFKALKQRVLWKFEETDLDGKSDNVYISDWFPQDDILAHPNVKLFITHGGLLSTMESIYHGKPIVGIPMFGDQFLNMARVESGGFGVVVDYNKLSKDTFLSAIIKILKDPMYKKTVKLMSERYRDQPLEPLDLATYWVEYVARHKGAPHLHSAGQELSFVQYHNLDAIAILYGGILLVVAALVMLVVYLVLRFAVGNKKSKKVKKN